MKVRIWKAVLSLLVLISFAPSGLALADSNTQISISSPHSDDTVINTNIQINGKAPQNTIVTVVILDTDTNVSTIAHQPYGRIEGTVTTDSNGDWSYVPQDQIVPGRYSAQATYTTAQNQTIQSQIVNFVVVNSQGSSGQLSATAIRQLLIVAGSVLVVILIVIIVLIRRHRRKKRELNMANTHNEAPVKAKEVKTVSPAAPEVEVKPEKPVAQEVAEEKAEVDESLAPLFTRTDEGRRYVKQLDTEAQKIEKELVQAAEQLERTNAEVNALRDRLVHEQDEAAEAQDDNKNSTSNNNKDTKP